MLFWNLLLCGDYGHCERETHEEARDPLDRAHRAESLTSPRSDMNIVF
jgi:hypothetical protein